MFTAIQADKELVESYLSGNENALSALLERHKRKIFAHIRKYIKDKNAAEDVFQETFFKVICTLKSGKYNEDGKFLGWIMTIAHNLCVDFHRDRDKMPMYDAHNRKDDEYDIFERLNLVEECSEVKLEQYQLAKKLKALVAQLPEEQREIIIMRHNMDMSFKEIAEFKNISINTALGRMRYGLINLKKMIEQKKIAVY